MGNKQKFENRTNPGAHASLMTDDYYRQKAKQNYKNNDVEFAKEMNTKPKKKNLPINKLALLDENDL